MRAALAQLVEHVIRNDGVTCSSHVSGTIHLFHTVRQSSNYPINSVISGNFRPGTSYAVPLHPRILLVESRAYQQAGADDTNKVRTNCQHGADGSVKNLKPTEKPAKYSDGGGLHLLVNPAGSKLWRLSYRYGGKQKLLAFGAYPAISLSDARRKR
jgi:hypothetical protein